VEYDMQNQRGLLFLGLAILLGIAAVFVAQRWLADREASEPRASETVAVVVARVDLAVASTLSERQLDTVQWPKAYLPKGAFTSVEAAQSRVLRRPLIAGEPLLESALLGVGSAGGLPVLISPKHRAVSVKVDPVIGVAGFVKPGAHVDVLVTARRVDRPKAIPFSKVFLQDIRVLAVDQTLEQVKNGEPKPVNVVTLEVDPKQAEKLTYASHQGKLQLALRNPTDDEKVQSDSVGVADVLGEKRRKRTLKAGPTTTVQVIRGSSVKVKSF
jgi:pilus assembly protein CpaB